MRGVALALLLATAAACASPEVVRDGVRIPITQAVEQDLRRARAAIDAGDAGRAERLLETTVAEFPASPRLDEARSMLAEAQLAQGNGEAAVATLRRLVERHPGSGLAPRARHRLAELYRERGRPELARDVLRDARFGRASQELRARMYRLLADLAREVGDYPDAVVWLAYTRRETLNPEQERQIDLEVTDLLEGRVRDAELEELLIHLPRGPVYDRALLSLARRALDRGDPDAALTALGALPRRLRPQEEALREALETEAQRGASAGVRILGVAVPLSGPYAPFGEAVLRGVVLGLGLYDDTGGGYRLVVRDTRGDPARTETVVHELAAEGVAAIIGPVRSATAATAAPAAQDLRIPLLTLAQREDLPFLGDFIFRLGLTASDQVRMLTDHSIDRLGFRRFAILYPRDEYGTAFKNMFWDEVELRGGEIVGVEGYDPSLVDHQAEIKKLVGLYYLTPDERELIEERDRLARRPVENEERLAEPELAELPPYIDFDALFVPDEAQTVGLVLPQLRYYDVRETTLLGPSGWNDPALVEIAGREARGAVFTDAFFARSEYPFVQDFVSRFYSAYGDEPELLAAEGFDAASILRQIMEARGDVRTSREALRRDLLEVRDFPGVSGVTSFDEAGGTRKSLYLLTVRGDQIEELGSD